MQRGDARCPASCTAVTPIFLGAGPSVALRGTTGGWGEQGSKAGFVRLQRPRLSRSFCQSEWSCPPPPEDMRPWHPLCCPGHCSHTLHRADTQKVDTEGPETRARGRGTFPAWGDQDSADQRQPSGPLKSPDARSPQPHARPAHQHPAPAPLWATGGWTSTEDRGGHRWVQPPWTAALLGAQVLGWGERAGPGSPAQERPDHIGAPRLSRSPQPYWGPHLSHLSLTGGPLVMQLREL